jgi:hypothetical protein
LHPDGLRLPKGTHFYDNDQGSSLIVHTAGWMERHDFLFGTDYRSYLASELGYDASWTLGFWCKPELWAAGRCSRAFFNRQAALFPSGFMQFALCSQHGPQNSTDVASSCRARMHEQWEYWAGWSFANPWEDSIAEADLRQQFPWLSSPEFDPAQLGKFTWFGFESLIGPTPLVPGELAYHNSWTKPSRPDHMKQRHAMALYPDQLIIPAEDYECGNQSTLNPTCDQFVFGGIDINEKLGTPTYRSGPRTTWELEAWYEQEHLRGLSRVPGCLRARRLVRLAVDNSGGRSAPDGALSSLPLYVASYDLQGPEVTESEPWLAVRHTDWSSRVRPMFRNTRRTLFIRPDLNP